MFKAAESKRVGVVVHMNARIGFSHTHSASVVLAPVAFSVILVVISPVAFYALAQ